MAGMVNVGMGVAVGAAGGDGVVWLGRGVGDAGGVCVGDGV